MYLTPSHPSVSINGVLNVFEIQIQILLISNPQLEIQNTNTNVFDLIPDNTA